MINKFGFYKSQNPPSTDSPPAPTNNDPNPPLPLPDEPHLKLQPSRPAQKRTFLRAQEYHPFQIPPNLQLAELHCRATQFGGVSTASILQSQVELACNCCGQHQKQLMAVCGESKRIYRVSEAQGFYFTYIKVIVVALAMLLAISGMYNLFTTIRFCHSEEGSCLTVYGFPLPQDMSYFNIAHIVLGVISAFSLYPFILYLFYLRVTVHQHLKQSVIKISDYSLLISGVSPELSDRQLLSGLQGYSIESVLFTHRIGKYLGAMRKKYILQAKKNLYFKRGLTEKYDQAIRQIYQISNVVLPFKNNINIGNQRELRTDKIIVKFRTTEDRQRFFKKYRVNLVTRAYHILTGGSSFSISGIPLYVESLGEPQQMLWQNLQVSLQYKLLMMLINTCVSAIILGGSFAIILMLTRAENDDAASDDVVTSMGMAVLIELVNVVLYLSIFQLTQAERRITLTGKMMARITRNVLVFFFNTTLIPFSLFLLDWIDNNRRLVYEYIISLFFVTNLVSPFSALLNPLYLYKLYRRRKMKKEGRDCLFTQLQANEIFEKSDFQLELKYQLLCQRIMNCCFYAAVFPQVLLLTIIGLALDYWVQKWWLLRHCCIPKLNARLASVINRVSIFFPVVYLFGFLANLQMMRNQHAIFDDSDPKILTAFLIIALVLSLVLFGVARKLAARWAKDQSSVSIKELDYCDLNPTSFLHIDLKNTVDLSLQNRNRVAVGQGNFQRVQQFVLKQQVEALARRDSEIIRVSQLKDLQ